MCKYNIARETCKNYIARVEMCKYKIAREECNSRMLKATNGANWGQKCTSIKWSKLSSSFSTQRRDGATPKNKIGRRIEKNKNIFFGRKKTKMADQRTNSREGEKIEDTQVNHGKRIIERIQTNEGLEKREKGAVRCKEPNQKKGKILYIIAEVTQFTAVHSSIFNSFYISVNAICKYTARARNIKRVKIHTSDKSSERFARGAGFQYLRYYLN